MRDRALTFVACAEREMWACLASHIATLAKCMQDTDERVRSASVWAMWDLALSTAFVVIHSSVEARFVISSSKRLVMVSVRSSCVRTRFRGWFKDDLCVSCVSYT